MRPLLLVLTLVACAPVSPSARLVPLDPILAAADALPGEAGFAPSLESRADALASRAGALSSSIAPLVPDRARDLEASGVDSARLAALQARAAALRDGVLTEGERQRLEAGPSLPGTAGPANSAPDP